jgi:hypothetical protein
MNHDAVIVVLDIHGDEERMRVLYRAGGSKWWCKSLTNPHAKKRKVCETKVIRYEK